MKSLRILSFSSPYFPAFGLNVAHLSVFSPNAGKHGQDKTPYLGTFHAVSALVIQYENVGLQCNTAQKMKLFIKDFFSKSDQICKKLQIWSQLLKKFSMETSFFVQCKMHAKEQEIVALHRRYVEYLTNKDKNNNKTLQRALKQQTISISLCGDSIVIKDTRIEY